MQETRFKNLLAASIALVIFVTAAVIAVGPMYNTPELREVQLQSYTEDVDPLTAYLDSFYESDEYGNRFDFSPTL